MRNILVATLCVSTLAACTTTKSELKNNPGLVDTVSACRAYITTDDKQFKADLQRELSKRRVHVSRCPQMTKAQSNNIAAGVATVAVGAAAIYCISQGCLSGGGSPRADWDQFYNDRYQSVWACREISTGRFTEVENCSLQFKDDDRWPSKRTF